MASQTQNGVAVTIGIPGGLTITSPALQTYLIPQSLDETQEAERVLVHDSYGNRVASSWIDQYTKLALRFVITGTGLAAVQSTVIPMVEGIGPGQMINIATCPSQPGLIGSGWEVINGPKISATNRTAREYTLDVERAPGITGAAPS